MKMLVEGMEEVVCVCVCVCVCVIHVCVCVCTYLREHAMKTLVEGTEE